MVNRQYDISEKQDRFIKRIAKKEKIAEVKVVRHAIDQLQRELETNRLNR